MIKTAAAAAALVFLLAGCSSSTKGSGPSTEPYSEAIAIRYACQSFAKFTADVDQLTPKAGHAAEAADAGDVVTYLSNVVLHTNVGLQLYADAKTLANHVADNAWAASGSMNDPEVAAVAGDCRAAQ